MIRLVVWSVVFACVACGAQREIGAQGDLRALARDLTPRVERAVGLPFKSDPRVATRSSEQVRQYLTHKLDDELPPDELERMLVAYRILGLIPDTLDVRELLLALYLEQVVGYYDPDSAMLYMVDTADPSLVEFTLAHELVHALQGQYVPLDSLLSLKRQNDRKMAAQAVFEGQATLASFQVVFPDMDLESLGQSWSSYWRTVREQQERMPVYASAPLIIRETLVFPYLGGADFVFWFVQQHGDTVPFGTRLPSSTEQILHPERYDAGDVPVSLTFAPGGDVIYEDGLGEFETRVFLSTLTGDDERARTGAQGWDGDRYAVLAAGPRDHALVWVSVWDEQLAADRFANLLRTHWSVPGRRISVERVMVEEVPGVRVVNVPVGWEGEADLPKAVVSSEK